MYSHTITKKQYDYLLPIYGNAGMIPNKLLLQTNKGIDKYYFIGSNGDYKEMLDRCLYL